MAQKEANSKNTLSDRLKESIQERGGIYRLNVAPGTSDVLEPMAEVWAEHGIATISDWGLTKKYNVDLFTETDVPITGDVVSEEFQSEFGSDVLDWDSLRDTIAREVYANEENPKHHAGQVTGSIRRFVDEYSVGTVIVGNFPDGQVPGVVVSDCYYRPESPATEIDDSAIFVREIEWARDDNGDLLTISSDALPDAFQPARQTTTQVREPQQLIAVSKLMEVLIGGRGGSA